MNEFTPEEKNKRFSNGMKRVPHSIEGLFLAPLFAATLLFLKLSCPVSTGEGCFADIFFKIVFLPLPFLYKVFSNNPVWIATQEKLILFTYWALVGFLIGLLVDIKKKN